MGLSHKRCLRNVSRILIVITFALMNSAEVMENSSSACFSLLGVSLWGRGTVGKSQRKGVRSSHLLSTCPDRALCCTGNRAHLVSLKPCGPGGRLRFRLQPVPTTGLTPKRAALSFAGEMKAFTVLSRKAASVPLSQRLAGCLCSDPPMSRLEASCLSPLRQSRHHSNHHSWSIH